MTISGKGTKSSSTLQTSVKSLDCFLLSPNNHWQQHLPWICVSEPKNNTLHINDQSKAIKTSTVLAFQYKLPVLRLLPHIPIKWHICSASFSYREFGLATEEEKKKEKQKSTPLTDSEHLTHRQEVTAQQPKQLTDAHRERWADTETFNSKRWGIYFDTTTARPVLQSWYSVTASNQ